MCMVAFFFFCCFFFCDVVIVWSFVVRYNYGTSSLSTLLLRMVVRVDLEELIF